MYPDIMGKASKEIIIQFITSSQFYGDTKIDFTRENFVEWMKSNNFEENRY
jgi:hypothetical protein